MARTTFSGPVASDNGFIGNITGDVTAVTVSATGDVTAATVSATGNITADSNLAVVAGGTAAFLATTTAGLGIYVGSGAPTVSAAQGSLYLRTDGSSTSTRLYVNTNGSTTWTNVTTAA
jgi:hypothetical protein